MPARSCKDFINQLVDNITFKACYPTKVYERSSLDNNLWDKKDYIMNTIDYFKLQAKNLHRDFKTQTPLADKTIGVFQYDYSPTYFQIYDIISDFGIDEENFTLMNAQHVIAKVAGFDKWATLIKTEASELELAKLLFEHQDKIDLIAWNFYIADAQSMNDEELDAEMQVEIFKQVVIEDNIFDMVIDSYLIKNDY